MEAIPKTALFNLQRLTALRRTIHRNPESSFQEFMTSKAIREYLLSLGVPEQVILSRAGTGLQVDIRGRGPPVGTGLQVVALRADIDALEMLEDNSGLEYRSTNSCAHMCGHDGHIACLVGGLSLLLEDLDAVPSDRGARFLFQPAEEKLGGALRMVQEGCLEGVREVWGLHNYPVDPAGCLLVKEGLMMSEVNAVRVTVHGRGGHSSLKQHLRDPTLPACDLVLELERVLQAEFAEYNNKTLLFSLPSFKGSVTSNVLPDAVVLEGTLRIFDPKAKELFLPRLQQVVSAVAEKHQVKADLEFPYRYPMVVNDKALVEDFKQLFDTSEDHLPLKASEDFSEFANVVPGCFFIFGIGSKAGKSLHAKNYNFNDDVIEQASRNWVKLIKHRLSK